MSQQEQLLAFAVYEIRLLLAGHLGSQSTSELPVRAAAHLAYALHNEADNALRGNTFDAEQAIERLGAVDRMLGTDFQDRFAKATSSEA
ncbi:hypothetical protein [Novilysobacter defluvii]|uniref:hypothetical protein n=1 Tax=Novilysobacter defluvii TaxID=391738 RepID=UPI0009DBF8C8|nr:hypothetical protein [Lysobacter defluvii]